MINKIKKYSEKFHSKTAKFLALWGSFVLLGTVASSIFWGAYKAVLTIIFLSNSLQFKEDSERIIEYQNYMIEALYHLGYAETDPIKKYGIDLREMNAPRDHDEGDLLMFTEIEINGIKRPIIYHANLNKTKGGVQITDLHGNVKLIKR